jgi:hypothetical protein
MASMTFTVRLLVALLAGALLIPALVFCFLFLCARWVLVAESVGQAQRVPEERRKSLKLFEPRILSPRPPPLL